MNINITQNVRSCSICGAIVSITQSQDHGNTWDGTDNRDQHAEWHARRDTPAG